MPHVGRSARRAVMGAMLVSSALGMASTASAATFTHRTVLTIDRTQVPGVASLTNFPVLVSVTAAQRDYAETGLMPELLVVYQALGDPAMRIRQ